MKLTDFDTLTFDCYGTLIDWETGIFEGLRPLLERVKQPLTRDQVLEAHARHESSQQKYTPAKRYQDLLPIVYKRLAEEWQVPFTLADCVAYGKSVQNWPAFEDSADALPSGTRTCCLSCTNGWPKNGRCRSRWPTA